MKPLQTWATIGALAFMTVLLFIPGFLPDPPPPAESMRYVVTRDNHGVTEFLYWIDVNEKHLVPQLEYLWTTSPILAEHYGSRTIAQHDVDQFGGYVKSWDEVKREIPTETVPKMGGVE